MNLWWLVVFCAVFLIGVTKSGFGAGVGLMIVPMTAIAMGHIPQRGSEAALGLLLPLLITGDFIALWQYRSFFRFRPMSRQQAGELVLSGVATLPQSDDPPESSNAPETIIAANATSDSLRAATVKERSSSNPPLPDGSLREPLATDARPSALSFVRQLLPGTLLGVVLGGLLLWWFHQHTRIVGALIRVEIGIESIGLVGLHWWRQYRGMQQSLMREPWRGHITGAFAAVSSTLAHAAGPIIAMYLLPLRLDRRLFVGTCAIYFFMLNSAKLPAYFFADQFRHAQWNFTLKFVPLVIGGALFGSWINRRISDKLFTRFVYLVTFILGWYILYDGIARLL